MKFIKEPDITVEHSHGPIGRFPDFYEIMAIEKLINGLEWIYEEFLADCARYPDCEKALLDRGFSVRNTTRTLAYTNHAGVLEGLIRKSYAKLAVSLRFYIDSNVVEDKSKLDLQKVGFERTKAFRNKVAAHLAYVDPIEKPYKDRVADNHSTQITSLMAVLTTGCTGNDPKMFCLGGSAVVVGGETPSNPIPPMNIYATHRFLKIHYEKWGEMFDELLRDAKKKLPIENEKFKVYLAD